MCVFPVYSPLFDVSTIAKCNKSKLGAVHLAVTVPLNNYLHAFRLRLADMGLLDLSLKFKLFPELLKK